jgi:hypothetical protein
MGLNGFDHQISLTWTVRRDDRLGDGAPEKSKTFWGIWGMEARRE